jgi:hypothetical protein
MMIELPCLDDITRSFCSFRRLADDRAPLGPHPNAMDKNDKFFQIAILLYPGVTALDAVGPWEVLSRMPKAKVRFVGKEVGPVMTDGGALVLGVTHTIAETLSPDLVLVPGGATTPGQMVDGGGAVGVHESCAGCFLRRPHRRPGCHRCQRRS